MDTAKVFMTGRSQVVRLPKAYRFETDEVSIEGQADGAIVLRAKPQGLLGDRLWAILDGLPDDPTFVRPDQGFAEERDWLDDSAPKSAVRRVACPCARGNAGHEQRTRVQAGQGLEDRELGGLMNATSNTPPNTPPNRRLCRGSDLFYIPA